MQLPSSPRISESVSGFNRPLNCLTKQFNWTSILVIFFIWSLDAHRVPHPGSSSHSSKYHVGSLRDSGYNIFGHPRSLPRLRPLPNDYLNANQYQNLWDNPQWSSAILLPNGNDSNPQSSIFNPSGHPRAKPLKRTHKKLVKHVKLVTPSYKRHGRSVQMSASEVSSVLDKHNSLRRLEGASNMDIMVWNDYLASMAQDWANGCNFEHGQPSRDPSTMPYSTLGQNLFAISGEPLNVSVATQQWFNEKQYYTFETATCASNQACGHYTQVVWATSVALGCAYSTCSPLKSTALTNAVYLVCNYGPAGNYVGAKPYLKGTACNKCDSGSAWCNNGLCTSGCTGASTTCDCSLSCANCGVLDKTSCKCVCRSGWTGIDCSVRCEDLSSTCGNGWPESWCTDARYQSNVLRNCPAMCGTCDPTVSTLPCDTTKTELQPKAGAISCRYSYSAVILSCLYCIAQALF